MGDVMRWYQNIRESGDVLGVAPGKKIKAALHPAKEQQLIAGGHIKKVKAPKAKKPKAGT